ncbi:hypothetical protein [Nostoc sp. MS1]|uniref:hypothetical protein n=1 Tax=Nostoc sp. MS1 TaxID=2764711 RepID=UPI001CC5F046|nr:hypothetical protein [Nostoc sp. MS1]
MLSTIAIPTSAKHTLEHPNPERWIVVFVDRQITYYFVSPYTFIAENLPLSSSLTVNYLTNI